MLHRIKEKTFMLKKNIHLSLFILIAAFFAVLWTVKLMELSERNTPTIIHGIEENIYQALMGEVKYFPVTEFINKNDNITFVDSFGAERTYGGNRTHEGCDIIPSQNKSDYYPIVSMTDGTITKMGWLEKGGYRIGVTTKNGFYFYYAHLSSYAEVAVGDSIKAGELLGFMGNTGYGPEGTVGQFVVHLHLGIYQVDDKKEVSLNPYWILRNVEKNTVKCYTEE